MTGGGGSASAGYRGETLAEPRLAVLRSFLRTEAGGAIVLLAATVLALVWANSPWGNAYDALWATEIAISAGDYRLSDDLRQVMKSVGGLPGVVIVDDVAAVTVIAVAYSTELDLLALAVGIGLLVVTAIMRHRSFQGSSVYALLGVAIWLAAEEAGVHPAVAGVALGLFTSAYTPRREELHKASAHAGASCAGAPSRGAGGANDECFCGRKTGRCGGGCRVGAGADRRVRCGQRGRCWRT